MRIYFNDKVKHEPWGGGIHFLSALVEFLKKKRFKVTFKLKKNIDIVFLIKNNRELDSNLLRYLKKNPRTKVLQRINISDISKKINFQDKLVLKINKFADETVFISNWLADYFIKKGFNRPYHVIYNGCNTNFFYPLKNKKFNPSLIHLVTHHWSTNWMKGFDIYSKLDQLLDNRNDIKFTFIGRYSKKYIPKNTVLIKPLYGKKLGDELRKHDIYLTAARWEGCGMHHIEGASCGLPVLYHQDGGGINESCKNYGIEYNDITSLLEGLSILSKNYVEYKNKIPYEFLSMKRCCEDYFKILNEMV
ncbi:MAG: glycosyltransferase [Promethearchaeota archaeon]